MRTIEGEEQKRIRKFFAGIFVDKEKLMENNINYPIKLEYYKIRNLEDEYGVEIVKTEYREEYVKFENDAITNITKEEEKIDDIISKLKNNLVTPIELKEVIEDILI